MEFHKSFLSMGFFLLFGFCLLLLLLGFCGFFVGLFLWEEKHKLIFRRDGNRSGAWQTYEAVVAS